MPNKNSISIVLTGGGARGAYQVGALKAIYEIAKDLGIEQPFDIITGNSAGSINAIYLAAGIDKPEETIKKLTKLWINLHSHNVYKVDCFSLILMGGRFLFEFLTGSLFYRRKTVLGLLDTSPLRSVISKHINFKNIQKNIKKGFFKGIAIRASNYSTGKSEVFFQGVESMEPWERKTRLAKKEMLTMEHIMASTAIPLLFPPVKIGRCYYGDGSLRSYTPLSPSIKMGANKIIVIGVSQNFVDRMGRQKVARPSMGRILSLMLNSVILDGIDLDVERLTGFNSTIRDLNKDAKTHLKHIDICLIRPTKDIGIMATEEVHNLPSTMKHLLKGLGTKKDDADLSSYLLFEPSFAKRLIDLGYEDTLNKRAEIESILKN